MKVSVVTICLNAQETIAQTITSFLSQSHPDKELLVIDGASTDGTLDIVKGFQASQIQFISEPDKGIYDAMNKGFALYSGQAIGFLNSNDRFHDNDALARISTALEQAEAVHGGVLMVKDHDTKRAIRRWNATPFKRGKFRSGWMPPHPAFYIRRSLAQKTGKFDLRYQIASDYDYMLRALELHAASTIHICEPLVDFLVGGKSSGSFVKVLKGNLECLQSRREHLGAPWIDLAFFLKPGLKLVQQHVALKSARGLVARFSKIA